MIVKVKTKKTMKLMILCLKRIDIRVIYLLTLSLLILT